MAGGVGVIPVCPHQQQYFAAERWRRVLGVPPFSVGSWDEGHGHLHTTPLLKEGAWQSLSPELPGHKRPCGVSPGVTVSLVHPENEVKSKISSKRK